MEKMHSFAFVLSRHQTRVKHAKDLQEKAEKWGNLGLDLMYLKEEKEEPQTRVQSSKQLGKAIGAL